MINKAHSWPQRTAIIGNAAGGKTTLARQMSLWTGCPVTHVDSVQFQPGMKLRPYKDSIEILLEIQNNSEWIIDGYGPLDILEKRLAMADQIVFIDLPLWRHIFWFFKRQLRNFFSQRPELPENCSEANFEQTRKTLRTIRSSHKQMRPELIRILNRPDNKSKTLILRSPKDIKNFLSRIENDSPFKEGRVR